MNEPAREVAEAMGVPVQVVYLERRKEVQHAYSSHDRLHQVFGHGHLVTLAEGLRRMAVWARSRLRATSRLVGYRSIVLLIEKGPDGKGAHGMATSRDPPGFTRKTGRLQLWTPLLRELPDWGKPFYPVAKRVADLIVSCLLLVFLSPLFLLVGLLIRLDSPGSIIFVQERMGCDRRGRRHRPFACYKFRSMYSQCDQSVHERHVSDCIRNGQGKSGLDNTGALVKLADDNRITPFGRILRRTSLDELPQLWNVLRGDMSLVGPRPVPLYEVAQYNQWQMARLEATPGMTGLWQVKGRGRVTLDGMAEMDIDYVARCSFWLDLEILTLTVPAVIRGRGAG